MCNVSSGFYSVKWWQSEKENTGCGWRVEDVSSATAPSWEPSEAPVLTSGSLVQVQKSNQVTENTMRQPFPATSWPHPFSNQTLLFFQGGKKSPVAFDQTRKEEKQIPMQLPLSVGDCLSRAEESDASAPRCQALQLRAGSCSSTMASEMPCQGQADQAKHV